MSSLLSPSCRRRPRPSRRARAQSRRTAGSSIAASNSRTRSARKLKHSTPSPSRMPWIAADHGGQDELVGDVFAVGVRNRGGPGRQTRRPCRRRSRHRPSTRAPAVVAIHRVVAARDGRNAHGRRQVGDELRHSRPRGAAYPRPSMKAWDAHRMPAPLTIFASATAWFWCECTPPGETRPIRWQVPPVCFSLSMNAPSTGLRASSPLPPHDRCAAAPASRRGPRRCCRCSTSGLPTGPVGRRDARCPRRAAARADTSPRCDRTSACWPGERRCRPSLRASPSRRG